MNAHDFFSQTQRSRNQCCLPNHDYDHGVWPYSTASEFGSTAIAVAATDPTEEAYEIKPFHLRATALEIDHLTLDRVGIALHRSTGRLVATGRISHTGGENAAIGNNITVRIGAYVSPNALIRKRTVSQDEPRTFLLDQSERISILGHRFERVSTATRTIQNTSSIKIATPNEVTRIPPDAYRVWTSENKLWVSRGLPREISLVSERSRRCEQQQLIDHFDNITHLGVELQYRRDR
ncbi:MAG: hypothetical protein ABJM81_28140 [Rhodopirellula bahusiensis]|uniref:hypothetical protein n=1 Tax=Rhodopirellula bahusiensis TaxID=2014065 RepID=UPI0032633898